MKCSGCGKELHMAYLAGLKVVCKNCSEPSDLQTAMAEIARLQSENAELRKAQEVNDGISR